MFIQTTETRDDKINKEGVFLLARVQSTKSGEGTGTRTTSATLRGRSGWRLCVDLGPGDSTLERREKTSQEGWLNSLSRQQVVLVFIASKETGELDLSSATSSLELT